MNSEAAADGRRGGRADEQGDVGCAWFVTGERDCARFTAGELCCALLAAIKLDCGQFVAVELDCTLVGADDARFAAVGLDCARFVADELDCTGVDGGDAVCARFARVVRRFGGRAGVGTSDGAGAPRRRRDDRRGVALGDCGAAASGLLCGSLRTCDFEIVRERVIRGSRVADRNVTGSVPAGRGDAFGLRCWTSPGFVGSLVIRFSRRADLVAALSAPAWRSGGVGFLFKASLGLHGIAVETSGALLAVVRTEAGG